MTVSFYLEIQNGEKHSWVNHTLTKESEIDWLLKTVRKELELALRVNDVNKLQILKENLDKGDFIKKRF